MNSAELADLVSRDPAVAALAAVLDPDRRLEVLGHTSRVTRIRYKPGSSIVAALVNESAEGRATTGWIAAYSDPAKLGKTLARAAHAGFDARAVEALQGVVVGETAADRVLSTQLGRLRRLVPGVFAHATVLRHNPHRRVVLRSVMTGQPVVLKVQAATGRTRYGADPASEAGSRALDGLERAGVRVLRPTALAGLEGAEVVPWWGDGDLATIRLAEDALRHAGLSAGRDLARLHNAHLGETEGPAPEAGRREDDAAVRSIGTILPAASDRAAAVAARLRRAGSGPARRLTVVHGDFSPDQVLVGGGETRLIDFDRCTIDSPERDLGSFLATAELMGRPELGRALIDGYTAAGGTADPRELHRFTAIAFLRRSVEPFRTLSPHWARQTEHALYRAESEAAQC